MPVRKEKHATRNRPRKLSQSELQQHVAERLLAPLRDNKIRRGIKQSCTNPDPEIETALCAAAVAAQLRPPIRAYIKEQTTTLIARLFRSAEAREAWAWKIILEVSGLAEVFREALAPFDQNDDATFLSSEFERRLIHQLRELVKPQGASDETHRQASHENR